MGLCMNTWRETLLLYIANCWAMDLSVRERSQYYCQGSDFPFVQYVIILVPAWHSVRELCCHTIVRQGHYSSSSSYYSYPSPKNPTERNIRATRHQTIPIKYKIVPGTQFVRARLGRQAYWAVPQVQEPPC